MQNHSDSLKGENVCKEIAGHFGGKVLRGLIIVWGFFSWSPGEDKLIGWVARLALYFDWQDWVI